MRILITGENSYTGKQFYKRISDLNIDWVVDFASVRSNEWKTKDFGVYDAIYHVAAIVHKKERPENETLYYETNRDLTYNLAVKAKADGVKSFIFLSTMAVYGLIGKIGEDTVISKETIENPTSFYGKSKLEAEQLINTLHSDEFQVSILRIPMIYGFGCPGNYKSLSNLAKKTPVFPLVNNKKSLIFIDYLSDVVIYLMGKRRGGVFLVKNPFDINTLDMVNEIARNHNKRIYNSIILGSIVKIFGNRFLITRKMFSNVFYKPEDCIIAGFKHEKFYFEKSVSQAEGIIK